MQGLLVDILFRSGDYPVPSIFADMRREPPDHLEVEDTMRKLSLRLESLDVQSFPTSDAAGAERGTVRGADAGKLVLTGGSGYCFTQCSCEPTVCVEHLE